MSKLNLNLNGKVVLITGGTRGIGKGIALEFARAGAILALNYKSNHKEAETTLEELKSLGCYVKLFDWDISSYKESEENINKIIKEFGKIDILVNNAGISKVNLFIDSSEEDWDNIMNTNLKGIFNCCRQVVPHMIKNEKGSIINISSMWGNVGASCEVIYSASKGGINSFTKALAKELGPSGVRVNAISPGVINTSMNNWLSDEDKDSLMQEIPLCKFGECEDVGNTALFLASDASKYITGQIITVDGGML